MKNLELRWPFWAGVMYGVIISVRGVILTLQMHGTLNLVQCEDRLETSESDAYRRQNQTSKVDPRAVRGNIFILVVDP